MLDTLVLSYTDRTYCEKSFVGTLRDASWGRKTFVIYKRYNTTLAARLACPVSRQTIS